VKFFTKHTKIKPKHQPTQTPTNTNTKPANKTQHPNTPNNTKNNQHPKPIQPQPPQQQKNPTKPHQTVQKLTKIPEKLKRSGSRLYKFVNHEIEIIMDASYIFVAQNGFVGLFVIQGGMRAGFFG
jgi:hypothetical protein